METPEKYSIGTPLHNFEDSPFFNYFNCLSPIKSVKFIPTDQTFSSLNFASPASVFTSPLINPHKESRFLRRHQFVDPLKLDFTQADEDENTSEGVLGHVRPLDYLDSESSDAGIAIDPSNKDPKSVIDSQQFLKYGCTSLKDSRIPCNDIETESSGSSGSPSSHVDFVQGVSKEKHQSFKSEIESRRICHVKETEEVRECDWVKFISDGSDKLIFDSCVNKEHSEVQDRKTMDPDTIFFIETVLQIPQDELDDSQKSNFFGLVDSFGQCETEEIVSTSRDAQEIKEIDQRPGLLSSTVLNEPVVSDSRVKVEDKKNSKCTQSSCMLDSQQQLSIQKHSVLYEMTATHRKRPIYNSDHDTSEFGVREDFNHSRPKRKRCRSDHEAESDACKHCNCKKSKCLKLYCECFAAGLYCVGPCSCQDCFNKPIHEDTVLQAREQIESRNPLAFAPKVIRISDHVPEFGDESNNTSVSAQHIRGCNCKKSSCLKKYCECFQGGVGCSISCRCEGCKNTFGQKDGTKEAELYEKETEKTLDKTSLNTSSQYNAALKGEEEHTDIFPPVTPSSDISRSLVQLPFTIGGGRPPQSSLLPTGSSSEMYTSQKYGPSGFIGCMPNFEKHLEMIPEDGTSEILHAESVHMTAKMDSKSNALVEIQACGSLVTEEHPYAMLRPLELF